MAQGNNRPAGPRKAPPRNPYAPPRGSRVPPIDAFDEVKRRPPPDLPPTRGGTGQARPAGQAQSQQDGRNPQAGRQAPQKSKNGQKPNAKGAQSAKKKKPKKKKRPVSPARRRRNRRIAGIVAVIAAVGIGIWFSINVLFKIDSIEVSGESPYSEDAIIVAFGREPGDNMFGFDAKNAQRALERAMPYLENVRIQRKLPSTLVIHVEQAAETYCLQTGEGYAVLSPSLKVLRMAEERPAGLTELFGLTSVTVTPGVVLALDRESAANEAQANAAQQASEPETPAEQAENPATEGEDPEDDGPGEGEPEDPEAGEGQPEDGAGEGEPETEPEPEPEPVKTYEPSLANLWESTPADRWDTLMLLMQALDESVLEDITWISAADTYDLQFRWQDRITVRLGTKTGLDDKLAYVIVLLTDRSQSDIGDAERGTLDASSYQTTLQAWFTSD